MGLPELDAGLTAAQVADSRGRHGSNELALHRASVWTVFWRQIDNPLLGILAVTTVVSYFFDDHVNAAIIFGIMTVGIGLGFINEYSSEKTVTDLLKRVSLSAMVIRDGVKQDVPVGDVVVGDVVLLHRGSVVPADIDVLEADSLSIDESALTGESLPVHKRAESKRPKDGWAFMGTVVSTGSGRGIVKAIAAGTEFGRISEKISETRQKTAFEKGLADLSGLITKVIFTMATAIGILNIGLGKDPLQAVLFALAVAIGLTPALLPMIVAVCMGQGAHRMAKKGVVVKQMMAIEDLGNMDVLCTDKTGTLTEGKINLVDSLNMAGRADDYVLHMGLLCNTATVHHKIVGNPMDVAIWEHARSRHLGAPKGYKKIADEEFNFEYRGQFAVARHEGELLYVFKGAPDSVLERCATYRNEHGHLVEIGPHRKLLRDYFHSLNQQGLRLVAVAQKAVEERDAYGFADAKGLELLGYMTFLDIPKTSAGHALHTLGELGVAVKIVTGDNEVVTKKVCEAIGLDIAGIVTGPGLERMNAHEKREAVLSANIFARVSPDQKQEIIGLLKKAGKVVGFMGDGVNDATALHMADVSISVNTAVDVAKDVANVVLLHKGLDVIADGVKEGRRIFANTIKYILMGTSSNFGNMFSMAGASFFLPFLPMTPSQILLNNSLYDASQLGLPSDEVDHEVLLRPHRWNVGFIYRYMLFFGPISSLFDFLSFAILWFGFHANQSQFQTGWFLESIATQVLIVFVIRTDKSPFFMSKPGKLLVLLCAVVISLAFLLPLTPLAPYLNLSPLPFQYYVSLALLIVCYLGIVEIVKNRFLKNVQL